MLLSVTAAPKRGSRTRRQHTSGLPENSTELKKNNTKLSCTLLRPGGDSTFVERWVGYSHSRAEANPETDNGKEGGHHTVCTHTCQQRRESCEAGRVARRPDSALAGLQQAPSLMAASLHPLARFLCLLRWGPTVTQWACSLSAGGGTEATAGPGLLGPACPLSLHPLP